jgi:sugar lactone lactonase YvrE
MATRNGRTSRFIQFQDIALESRIVPAVIDFANGFAADSLASVLPDASSELLLTDGPFQATAKWAPTPVHVQAFQTTFVFRLEGQPGRLGDGFTFALIGTQPAGPGAAGRGLGYAGLTDSVAVKFDLVDNDGEGGHSVGVFTGGADPTMPAVRLDGTPIHLHAQHPIRADINYDGAALTVTLIDLTLPTHTWSHTFAVDIPAAVGGSTAYAGFTAGTGELFARQAIESWTLDDAAPVNQPPVVSPISVQLVGPGHLNLGAQVADDGRLSALTYSWEMVSSPSGVTGSLQELPGLFPGTTRALADNAEGAGHYTFRLTVRDEGGLTASREVSYDFGPPGVLDPGPVETRLDFGSGFTASSVSTSGTAAITEDHRLRLVDGPFQSSAAFTHPVDVREFATAFEFQVGDAPSGSYGDGLTFVLQNAGPKALGQAGGGLGYEGITNSVAVKFDLLDNAGEGLDSVGVFTGGVEPTAPADHTIGTSGATIHLNSGRVFRVQLTYATGNLRVELRDPITGATFLQSYAVDIPAAVGGPTAYAGFTAGTGSLFAPIDVLDWVYAPTPDGDVSLPSDGTDKGGIITTVAGTGHRGFSGDDVPAIEADLDAPNSVAVDAGGNLFIADSFNHRVRRVDADTGMITTVAGTGVPGYLGNGGPATEAQLAFPSYVAVDANGSLYIADGMNDRIQRVDAMTGIMTTAAGTGLAGNTGDGGPATSATLGYPSGLAVDLEGNLYFADTENHRIRRVDAATGIITTVAGTGPEGFAGDGGPATEALFARPADVAVDFAGNLFIADEKNQRVRRVDAITGIITTVPGAGPESYGVPTLSAGIPGPTAVTVENAGNLFIADGQGQRIRRVDAATGVVTTVAGTGVADFGGDGGAATVAPLNHPAHIAVDAAGNLFIADSGNSRFRKVAATTIESE